MFEAALLVSREAAELSLLLLAVLALVNASGRNELKSFAVLGSVGGALIAVVSLIFLSESAVQSPVFAVLTILLGAVTLRMALSKLSSSRSTVAYVEDSLSHLMRSRQAVWMVMAFCALSGFRETLEAGLFLQTSAARHEASDIYIGAVLGAMVAFIVLFAVRSIASSRYAFAAYRALAVLVCFAAMQLILGGISDLLMSDALPSLHGGALAALLSDPHGVGNIALLLTILPALLLLLRWWRESTVSN